VLRLRAYAFAGAIAEVGLASVQGEIELTAEQVIDELVDLFHRIADFPPNGGDVSQDVVAVTGRERSPRR
jgi:hypothetical protein